MNLYLFYDYFIHAEVRYVALTFVSNPCGSTYLEFPSVRLVDEAY